MDRLEGNKRMHGAIYKRLVKAGLRQAADSYKEEVRRRRKAAKDDRVTANAVADDAMREVFGPVLLRWEKQQADGAQPKEEPALTGCAAPADLDQLLDPDYTETDPGKWLRDGLIWAAAEIRRVVIDSDQGTTVDLARAQTKPPTAWAVFCLEAFAMKKPCQRVELIAKVLPFATRSHDPIDEEQHQEGGGFLDSIG